MNVPAQAGQVGGLLGRSRLHPAVLRWLEGRRAAPAPWCVALSGGSDSVALLLLLWAHWPERRPGLVALHFNHRQRGRAAGADARFCRELCRRLGVRCLTGRWRAATKGASEAHMRAARQEFFRQAMTRLRSRVLWLAHQQNDIAETMLMRLARGSGVGGLAAPRPVQTTAGQRVHLRPLLTLGKSELVAALRTAGVKWREDASNESDHHFRNRLRRSVLPAWQKAAGRDALAGAALARDLLEEDDVALESWVDALGSLQRGVLDLRRLDGVPRAIQRRALHRWLLAVRPETDLSRQGFDLLLAAVATGKPTRFSLGRTGFAVIRQGKLAFKQG